MHKGFYARRVWALSFSLAATGEVDDFFPFLEVLRCFTSLRWRPRPMDSVEDGGV